jgi:hypothetical protein
MIRRLFTSVSALLPLLCVVTCVLWVRSYWVGDDRAIRTTTSEAGSVVDHDLRFSLGRGGVMVERIAFVRPPEPPELVRPPSSEIPFS